MGILNTRGEIRGDGGEESSPKTVMQYFQIMSVSGSMLAKIRGEQRKNITGYQK